MAKGIGNGVPLAAVVTTPQIASVLANRIHFNTFGGNPVVCARARPCWKSSSARNSRTTPCKLGTHILAGLEKLQSKSIR